MRVADHGFGELCPTIGPPVRRIEELPAVAVTQIGPGRHVVDFGQNSNGWIRLDDLGPAGTEVRIAYGEWLDPDGDLTQANIAQGAFAAARATPLPFQTDVVISAGDGAAFEPRHSTKGFQYVRLDGHPGPIDPSAIVSMVVHSDLTPAGGFECSDERINRLHRVAEWSFRGNACDIPTDCPTRERSGWVGDWQLYVATAAYLYDVGDFSAKWLADLAADQLESGAVTSIVPDPSPDAPIWRDGHGSAGWGDAAVHVPWELHRATGRTDVLADQFDSMTRWVDFAASRAASGRHRSRRRVAAGAGSPRDLPVGHRLALRRMARTRDEHGHRVRPARGRRPRPGGHRLPVPIGRRARPHRRDPRPHRGRPPPTASWPPTCSTPGEPSSSTPTGACSPTPRRTWCEPWRSASCPRPDANRPRPISSPSCARPTPISVRGSWPPRSCSRCSPTTATSTSPTSCCSRRPSRRGST